MTDPLPSDVLEERAADERRRLHNSVAELRSKVRERLDIKRSARENLWPAVSGVSLIGLLLGFGFAGVFTRR